jgi:hypothetical protein
MSGLQRTWGWKGALQETRPQALPVGAVSIGRGTRRAQRDINI